MSKCIACGMPMEKLQDHAGGDESKAYCVHCARPDGSMRSYNETLEGMTQFMVKTQGIDESAARTNAKGLMAGLPAWKGKSK